jgi:hypothetical protein
MQMMMMQLAKVHFVLFNDAKVGKIINAGKNYLK